MDGTDTGRKGSYKSDITCEVTKRAECSQHRIGWRQFIRGRITIQWGNIISTYLDQQGIKSICTEKWGATLLAINWRYVLSMLLLRNEEHYGVNPTDKTRKKKQKLIHELNAIINNNQYLPGSQLNMITIEPERYSELSLNQLQAHVHGASLIATINNQKREIQRKSIKRRRGVEKKNKKSGV
jgi:hypothetical protein